MYYFISPFYFKVPFRLRDYFGDRNKFTVEVGFGNGDFLINLASTEPEYGYLGVEISSRSVLKLTRKLMSGGLVNVRSIKIDAFLLFSIMEPRHSIDRIIYNFPDPWPNHPERRITARRNLILVHRVLRRDGELYLATDSDILKEDIKCNTDGIFKVHEQNHPFFPFYTKYQTKWIKEKREIKYYRLEPVAYNKNYPELGKIYGGSNMAHVIMDVIGKKDVPDIFPKRLREEGGVFLIASTSKI